MPNVTIDGREISPVFQRFCLLLRGLASSDPGEGAAHCEIGFGQGVSVNIHAAANPGLPLQDQRRGTSVPRRFLYCGGSLAEKFV